MPLQDYTVTKEEGVTLDGVDFSNGEVVEVDSDSQEVVDLLAEGSLSLNEEQTEHPGSTDNSSSNTSNEAGSENTSNNAGDENTEVAKSLFYGDKKVVGEVVDVEGGFKSFSVESGETFKLTEQDFNDNVVLK